MHNLMTHCIKIAKVHVVGQVRGISTFNKLHGAHYVFILPLTLSIGHLKCTGKHQLSVLMRGISTGGGGGGPGGGLTSSGEG